MKSLNLSSLALLAASVLSLASSPCLAGREASKPDTVRGRGGADAGGGGTRASRPVNVHELDFLLDDARIALLMTMQSDDAPQNYPELFGKSGVNILEIIANTPVASEMRGPCRDKNGAPVDGSIHNTPAGTICISSKNLAEKLGADSFVAQTLGLVGHEYGHLAGLDESGAVALQDKLIAAYSRSNFLDVGKASTSLYRPLNHLSYFTRDLINTVNELPIIQICNVAQGLEEKIGEASEGLSTQPFSMLTKEERNVLNSAMVRIGAITMWSCGQVKDHQMNPESFNRYMKAFAGRSSVTVEAFSSVAGFQGYKFSSESLQKIEGREDLKAELMSLDSSLKLLNAKMSKLQEMRKAR